MNKSDLIWSQTKAWCIANPEKKAAIAMLDGQFELTWNPRKPLKGADPVFYDEHPSLDAVFPSVHVERISGAGPLTPNPEGAWPIKEVSFSDFKKQYESLGDCVSCDGYVLSASEFPHCPTCARLQREGNAR